MPTTYRPYRPDQSFLLPPSPKDWLSEDHLVYFISETVDRLDLSGFDRRYQGDGRRNRPFDPRLMVKVLLYGYATGFFSSRKLAKIDAAMKRLKDRQAEEDRQRGRHEGTSERVPEGGGISSVTLGNRTRRRRIISRIRIAGS